MEKVQILIVDDYSLNRLLVKSILKSDHRNFVEANDGLEALELIKSNHFSLILLDIEMPNMNGIDVLRYIRQELPFPLCNIPVVAVTAYRIDMLDSNSILEELELGFNEIVTKPIFANDLRSIVKSYEEKLVNA